MISVVCVYNNERTLREVLLKCLANQTARFELITLDNRDNRFKSAAEALNFGGAKATGDHIMFAHQDMWLGSDSWMEDVDKILKAIPDLGIAGVAGMSEKGRNDQERRKWSIDVFDEVWWEGGNNLVQKPEEVQTLDECLLIVPKWVFSKLKFDEKVFDGWHCYGTDYCLCVGQLGLRAYVIPAYCCHSCLRRNMEDLPKFQQRLYMKQRKNYKHIYTWMGEVSWLKLRLRSLYEFLGPFYRRFFPDVTIILRRELSGCDRVLDLGCGHHSLIGYFDIPFSVGVELFEPSLQESRRKGIHSQYIQANITKVEFKPKSFDAVIATEVLEHLTKKEGWELLGKMETWARKKVIITTPNGYLRQDPYEDNPLQEHKSGWSPDELREFGFKVLGTNGWKRLRGYKTELKYKPAWLWVRISDLTQRVTYHCPKLAYQLLAVKQLDEYGER